MQNNLHIRNKCINFVVGIRKDTSINNHIFHLTKQQTQ